MVLVLRPFENVLDSENGFFKITKGRDINFTPESQPVDHLQPDQVLIIDGDVEVCYPQSGGGLCMLHGIKKKRRVESTVPLLRLQVDISVKLMK